MTPGDKTPREWEQEKGIEILDPDGWRDPYFKEFSAAISEEEFDRRAGMSTVKRTSCEAGSNSVPDPAYLRDHPNG